MALDLSGVLTERQYEEAAEAVEAGVVYDMALVRPKFEDYKREAGRIADEIKALEVTDDETLNLAVMLGGNAKKIAKAIDVKRREIVQEPSEFVKGVNGICKAITDALESAESAAKGKISQHQARVEMERRKAEEAARKAAADLQEKLRREAEEANRKAREDAARIAEAEARARAASQAEIDAARKAAEDEARRHEIEAPTVIAPVVPEAKKAVRTESAAAHQRKVWTFEILDAEAVPAEYKVVNDQAVRDAIKMGIRTIPGIRIYEESKTVFRT